MSPKEIAEKILLYNGKSFLNETVELARAYLDAAKELETNNTYIPMLEERMIELNNVNQKLKEELETNKAALSELEKEITKLKKSREVLRGACEFYSLMIDHNESAQWFIQMDRDRGHTAREALEADDNLMKEV